MENAVWSVIKYKPKAVFADEFKKALERVSEIMNKPDITYGFMELHTDELCINHSDTKHRCYS